ncbi:MAG TPA: addiction module protein [Sedimentisphaerales bacterium]|nr:addiction module protein [Sedimentisphaerales bacterium]
MERVELPISDLSLAQKLDLMEALWTDLSRDDKNLESPAWHKDVLEDRQKAFEAGKISTSDWGEAKRRLRMKDRQPPDR